MVDITKAPFSWEERPTTITWIDKLDAPTAVRQCSIWGILPASTLEENRVILKNHLRGASVVQAPPPPHRSPPSLDTLSPPRTPPAVRRRQVPPQTHTPPPTPLAAPMAHVSVPPAQPQPEWLHLVEATAQAIGTQIAAAFAQLPIAAPQPQAANPGTLPRAVIDAVKDIPVCSGGNSHVLLDFLIACEKLLDLDLADNRQLLIAILPRTSGRVRTTWTHAIAHNTLLHDLCQDLAEIFIPDPTRHQLVSDAIFRRQGPQESLTDFITSVQEAARILLPQGGDLLETIMAKINSRTRARLAGLRPAETVEQLLQLAPLLEVIRVTEVEERRELRTNAPTPHQYNTHFRRRDLHNTAPPRRTYYNTNYHSDPARARAPADPRPHYYRPQEPRIAQRGHLYNSNQPPNYRHRGAYHYDGNRALNYNRGR